MMGEGGGGGLTAHRFIFHSNFPRVLYSGVLGTSMGFFGGSH